MVRAFKQDIFVRGVAQFGRALRSGRRGRKFESCRLDSKKTIRPDGQVVKTTASHAVIPSSTLGQVTQDALDETVQSILFKSAESHAHWRRPEQYAEKSSFASVAQSVERLIRNQ